VEYEAAEQTAEGGDLAWERRDRGRVNCGWCGGGRGYYEAD
jgi:hypothetical protein